MHSNLTCHFQLYLLGFKYKAYPNTNLFAIECAHRCCIFLGYYLFSSKFLKYIHLFVDNPKDVELILAKDDK